MSLLIRIALSVFVIIVFQCQLQVYAQSDSMFGKFISESSDITVQSISGDGRFVAFVSKGNHNTAGSNRNNSDGNSEIFLFDYAQRHIFQITNTKRLLNNPYGSSTDDANIKVDIGSFEVNISNDGRWLVIVSNATTSNHANSPNSTNPGNFDANSFTDPQGNNPLTQDGNTEIWLYQLPAYSSVTDLSSGVTPSFVDLSLGIFTQVTNTSANSAPQPGTSTTLPFISYDNRDVCINDNGAVLAFISNRDFTTPGNPDKNAEIFTWIRSASIFGQVTETQFATTVSPIFNQNPSISGDGRRIAFYSNGTNPIVGMNSGTNIDSNGEIFLSDLDDLGKPTTTKRQVTSTIRPNPSFTVNSIAKHALSRDGRYIAFESRAQHNLLNGGSYQNTFALFLYDSSPDINPPSPEQRFRQVLPRSSEDSALNNRFDVRTGPRFTDYDTTSGLPGSLAFTTRMNITSGGSIPSDPNQGLNNTELRQGQTYLYSIAGGATAFRRLTNPSTTDNTECVINSAAQIAFCGRAPVTSNSHRRMAYEQTLRVDQQNRYIKDAGYLITPSVTSEDTQAQPVFLSGASDLSLTPPATGLAPNMLASVSFTSSQAPPTTSVATDVSNGRRFPAPIELGGARLSIGGFAAPIIRILAGRINFIVPAGVQPGIRTVTINHNGVVIRGTVNIVKAQPDIQLHTSPPNLYLAQQCPCAPGGRAKIYNVTNPNNPLPEPFQATTQTPGGLLPTRLRLYLTGVHGLSASQISIRIGNVVIAPSSILTDPVATDYPGVFTIDFTLPPELNNAGDVPIIVTATVDWQTYQSRTEANNAPRLRIILPPPPTDLAVWRRSTGAWYVMNGSGGLADTGIWGNSYDTPTPGDYDGDGKTDFAVYRPSNRTWYVIQTSTGAMTAFQWGLEFDVPVPADYDGDRRTDYAVYRPSTGVWAIYRSSDNTMLIYQIGNSTDTPVPADYDGDGKADAAVWRDSTASWLVFGSASNAQTSVQFGLSGDQPVPGDYDGDGRFDFAVWRGDNNWYIRRVDGSFYGQNWGVKASDIAVQGDYDADGRTDIAIWRPNGGYWYILKSGTNTMRSEQWGAQGDVPVPAPYRR